MLFINYAAREINLKIVYYGPGLSGKTTTVKYIFAKTDPDRRGALLRLETESDRTLFFDFLPLTVGKVGGFSVRFHLYSVPGQIFYAAARKLVMRGADAVIFVADSQAGRYEANIESLENMRADLAEHSLEGVTCAVQYTKRDSPTALPVEELRAALNPDGLPEWEAVASDGAGVFDTLRGVTKLVMTRLRDQRVASR
jgi:signal recognition particle receptor subunit beta